MPKTVLLADDSVTIQKVVGITFANEDVELVTENNGDAALARAREITPDIVLADVVLPGDMSGPEFAEEAARRYPSLKVVFVSGYPAEAATRNGFLGAGKQLLNKPYQRRQLAQALRAALA